MEKHPCRNCPNMPTGPNYNDEPCKSCNEPRQLPKAKAFGLVSEESHADPPKCLGHYVGSEIGTLGCLPVPSSTKQGLYMTEKNVKLCKLPGCNKKVAKGYKICPMHRNRMNRTGSYDLQKHNPVEKLRRQIEKETNDCITYDGYFDNYGYGRLYKDGKNIQAHRVAYELKYGKIPKGLCVCHKCDNPACINPIHLFLGTITDNNADKVNKGRHMPGVKYGENNASSKLSLDQVNEIRASDLLHKDLAKKYDVSIGLISLIINNKIWKDIS